MSTIQLPGLVTGIDTSQLIAQLMAVESRTRDLYTQRKTTWDDRKSALSDLESKLSNFKSSILALSDANGLRAFNTASSDTDKLTAEASSNAFEGNHTVVINQLATAERWVHSAGLKYAEDCVGAGTFIYSYDNKETTLTTTADTTLQDLVGLINNDANNPGVTASLLYYNSAYHLVLNGNGAGSDYAIHINSGSTEVWKSDSALTYNNDNATLTTKIKDLDAFSGTRDADDVIEITGADHFGVAIPQVNLSITGNTTIGHLISEINDAFDGRAKAVFEDGKIILTDSTAGASSLSVTLTYNNKGSGGSLSLPMSVTTEGNAATASLTGFAASDFIRTQTAQDSEIKVDGFPSTSPASEVQTVSLATAPNNVPDGGTFTLTYRGQTTADIAWDADAATIQAALEALSSVNSGAITVSGSISDGATFTFADTLSDVDLLMINSSLTDGGAAVTAGIAETTKGSDGYIHRSSNTVDDVIQGVTLHLHDTTTSAGEQVTLTRDIQSVKDKLNSMITAYNLAVTFIKEKTGYNEANKTAGVLMGDYVVSTIRSQIRTPLIAQTSGFIEDIDTFLMPGQLGLELDKDGVLSLDTNAFDEAIAKDYLGALAIIGANKTGSTDSNTVKFYQANSSYTTAGTYNVQVVVNGGVITSAKIKASGESTWRDATYSDNIVTGNSTFDSNGDPVYAENGLQLSVDLSQDGTFNATVRVKQGFTGAIEDMLNDILKTTTGSIHIDEQRTDDQIKYLQDKIDLENYRLDLKQQHLTARFARLEKTLALLQSQMGALGMSTK
jgi:flagellar hook-associated protein 2